MPTYCEGTSAIALNDALIYVFCGKGSFQAPAVFTFDPNGVAGMRWKTQASPVVTTGTITGVDQPNVALVGKFITYVTDPHPIGMGYLMVYDTGLSTWIPRREALIDGHTDGFSVGIGDDLFTIGGYTYNTVAERLRLIIE
jgi:hypothetical protein